MKPINQYAKLDDFIADINTGGNHLSFKIMGKRKFPHPKKGGSSVYYTASMLAEIYNDIEDPDQTRNFQSTLAPFGEILKVGCRLYGGTATYSTKLIPNPKNGANVLQGDLIETDLSTLGGIAVPPHRLSMMISHSCAITNAHTASLVPVYFESDLDDSMIAQLRGSPPKNAGAVRAAWLGNEHINFLGLPAVDIAGINDRGDRMLACLHLQTVLPKNNLPSTSKIRLTYRALSYLQLRIALLYMRDVQDSDDTRDF